MMKKFGFTLAEVLITLGIVGVIAAMTIPTFVTNSQNKANASRLSSTISNLENAFGIMMVQEGANTFDETEFYEAFSGGKYTEAESILGKYLKLSGSGSMEDIYGVSDPFKEIGSTGRPETTVLQDSDIVIKTKNNAVLMIANDQKEKTESYAQANGLSISKLYLWLRIDVNGASKPNITGRDVFAFMVGEDGALYPTGGKVMSVIRYSSPTTHLYSNVSSAYACTNGKFSTGCTARLIENNFVVDY